MAIQYVVRFPSAECQWFAGMTTCAGEVLVQDTKYKANAFRFNCNDEALRVSEFLHAMYEDGAYVVTVGGRRR